VQKAQKKSAAPTTEAKTESPKVEEAAEAAAE
jgi:hypothetical protein